MPEPNLLAAPLPATVGLGRETTGQAVFRGVLAALSASGRHAKRTWQAYRRTALGGRLDFSTGKLSAEMAAAIRNFVGSSGGVRMTMTAKSDLITAEIIRNYFETVCGEISKVVENTSISPIFSETHDYSVGIFFADERGVSLLARAQSVPVHIFAASPRSRPSSTSIKTMFTRAICFFASDPYYGGSHIPDWTVVNPIFVDGKPRFFTSVRGHVNDVGGCAPGGYNTLAREIWQEGFRVPPVKLRDRGELVSDVWNLILCNTRTKDDITGDLNAMVGGCIVGEQRLRELADEIRRGGGRAQRRLYPRLQREPLACRNRDMAGRHLPRAQHSRS